MTMIFGAQRFIEIYGAFPADGSVIAKLGT